MRPGAPRRLKTALAAAALAILAALAAFVFPWTHTDSPDERQREDKTSPVHVGAAVCATCHAKEHAAWSGSQHAQAMQPASADTVLGNFGDVVLRHRGSETRFFRRDGKFLVRTDGPDGKPGEFEIGYTFGVAPLQQYLVALPDGRLQALGVAWDTRPKAQGGQRWFHLYPDRTLRAGDPLHWTGIDQNWNYQCADCHSTNVRKNFDPETHRFATSWSEINVACEACHGPGSQHVAWARKEGDWRRFANGLGLTAALDEREGVTWSIDPATGNAVRSKPREAQREIEVCARCHARRGQFTDRHVAGQPFHDAFRPALLDRGLYHADGQQRDEVYTYGSFLQSRMHAKGVTCADCHDPHTQQLRAPGNGVCAQCHASAKYDSAAHHHHSGASAGAECAACHMPTATYMVVDPRHDHSFRIPRPDRTIALGTPNACNACHADRTARWAAERIRAWFPDPKPGFQTFAEAFNLADRGAPGAQAALAAVATDASQSPIARASAIARLGRGAGPGALGPITRALEDPDANVRMAAVGALAGADDGARAHHLAPLLEDPVRAVRMEAARAIVGPAQGRLTAERRAQFARALEEFVAGLRFNADRPEAHATLGNLLLAQGDAEGATREFRTAVEIDPTFVQGWVNLADVSRGRGFESQAEAVLRDGLERNPGVSSLQHALGLSLVRQGRTGEAIALLAAAASGGADNPRFAYVYAVALHDTGKRGEALRVVKDAVARHPYDRELLRALALYARQAGDIAEARRRVALLRELEPEDAEVARLASQLGGASR